MVSASATAELSEEEGETAKGANRLSSCDIKEHADTRREQSQRAELISLLSQARDESAPGKSNEKNLYWLHRSHITARQRVPAHGAMRKAATAEMRQRTCDVTYM